MRGKGHLTLAVSHMHRITPAYAGKSFIRELLLIVSRDHPRICGEKMSMDVGPLFGLGSPPRMRGKATSRTRRRTTAGGPSGACAATSNAHNGHQPKAIGLAAPYALTQQRPELFCIGHL